MGLRAVQNFCGTEAEWKVVMEPTRAQVAFIHNTVEPLAWHKNKYETKSSKCVHVRLVKLKCSCNCLICVYQNVHGICVSLVAVLCQSVLSLFQVVLVHRSH